MKHQLCQKPGKPRPGCQVSTNFILPDYKYTHFSIIKILRLVVAQDNFLDVVSASPQFRQHCSETIARDELLKHLDHIHDLHHPEAVSLTFMLCADIHLASKYN
jgi:hypothetical protein